MEIRIGLTIRISFNSHTHTQESFAHLNARLLHALLNLYVAAVCSYDYCLLVVFGIGNYEAADAVL